MTQQLRPWLIFQARLWLLLGLCVAVPVFILSLPLTAELFVDQLQVFPVVTADELNNAKEGPATAIVVLAAGRRPYAPEFGGETLDDVSLERVRYGAALERKTGLPVLVSGGLGEQDALPLADLMAQTLSNDYGIEVKWRETRSSNTAENAIYSAEILKQDSITRILLVTHAWHMRRAVAAFVANGIAVIPAPTAFYGRDGGSIWSHLIPSMKALRMSGYAIHETIGREWYALRYGY